MGSLPLRSIRVADFSWAAAGPYSTLLLASLGAEVIKVTSARAQGGFPRQRAAEVDRYLNYNKRSISLDLTTSGGAALAMELIRVCDLVVENYRPGTMRRFGLNYEELVKVKPDIVMISSSSLGSDGPQSRYSGFAPIFATMGGLSHITGYPGGIPTEFRIMIDHTVGYAAAYAALAALYRQRTTGQGQYVDLASRDVVTSLIGEHILGAQLGEPGSEASPRIGNRDESMAPHGVYRCKGEDAWITIAVGNQEEWEALCGSMGRQNWLTDKRFADGAGRWSHQDELDREINAWTAGYTPFELMDLLQRSGVAAVPSYSARDLFDDPHLRERGFSEKVTDSEGSKYTIIKSPWRIDGQRPGARHRAPHPGEDSPAIIGDLLGVSQAEIERLIEEGVIR